MRNPNLKIFPISAKTGEGVEAWTNRLKQQVDGWNCSLNQISPPEIPFGGLRGAFACMSTGSKHQIQKYTKKRYPSA